MLPKEILEKVQRIQIRTKHMVNDSLVGRYHSAFKGQGMEFHEVREYFPGDDIRAIDWNVTARMGHPFIKKFVEEREMTVMLAVDISASNNFGSSSQLKRDLAAEIAAVLAFSAIQNNDRVGLILFTDEVERYVPPSKGTRHVLRVIREVLYHQPRKRGTLAEPALTFLNHVTHRKAVVFLISDYLFKDEFVKPVRVAARKHDLVGVLVGDKREKQWPKAGIVEWEDAETGKRFLVDSSHGPTRKRLASIQENRRRETLTRLRSCGVDTIEVNAGEAYEKEFIRFFQNRESRIRS